HGLHCVRASREKWHWFYLPGRPDVQRDTAGAPQLTIVDAGTVGYLVFTATWGASARDLESLRDQIAVRLSESSAARVVLSFAPVSAPRCHALVGPGGGAFETVASSETSGIPPYDAVFNLALRGEHLESARGACQGRAGLLAVEYVAKRQVP